MLWVSLPIFTDTFKGTARSIHLGRLLLNGGRDSLQRSPKGLSLKSLVADIVADTKGGRW